MTQGFDQGGGAYSRYETYPEQRQDGSVWEVTYDRETGAYVTREVLPPQPPAPAAETGGAQGYRPYEAETGGAQSYDPPRPESGGAQGYRPYETPMARDARTAGRFSNALADALARTAYGVLVNPAAGALNNAHEYLTGVPGQLPLASNTFDPLVNAYNEWRGPVQAGPSRGTRERDGFAGGGSSSRSPAPTSGGSGGGGGGGVPGGNPNAGEGRGNGRPQSDVAPGPYPEPDAARKEFGDAGSWPHGIGPRYEQYSERRADGSTAIVTFDRATGRYSSTDTRGNPTGNAGGGAPAGGSGTPGRAGGGVDLREFTANPANAAWWQEFQYQNQGMDPIAYYQQYNNYARRNDARRDANGRALPPTETEALQMALADRAWGDALFRERGFAPTQSDWMSHYYANSPAPYRGMSNEYRGGPGDVGAYAGRGGNASGGGGNWVEGPDGKPVWRGG